MAKLICFLGSLINDKDALPLSIYKQISENFPRDTVIQYDPTEELDTAGYSDIILIDTIIGINTITVYSDINQFQLSPRVTVHDYDLPLTLGILKKLGKLPEVKIIGIPPNAQPATFAPTIISLLLSI